MTSTRIYVTQNSEYSVDHVTPDGREIILLPSRQSPRPYAIIGFADPTKLSTLIIGSDRYWHTRDTKQQLNRGKGDDDLEAHLEKVPALGLQMVAWLVDDDGRFVGPNGDEPDEFVSSPIKNIR